MADLKCIAFLDILGFSNYVTENNYIGCASNLLYEVSRILQIKMTDQVSRPPESQEKEVQPIALRTAVTSFEHFLPMSDSIFVSADSKKANLFIEQLSKFLSDCFMRHAKSYLKSADHMHPQFVPEMQYNCVTGKIDEITSKWCPPLFRGGISYGEVEFNRSIAIADHKPTSTPNLIGKGVVSAVKLECTGKGPKLFIDDGFYDLLNDTNKALVSIQPNECKHFLWPACYYIPENSIDIELIEFRKFSKAAIDLWKAFRCQPYGNHYFELMRLSIASFIKLSKIKYFSKFSYTKDQVRNFLQEQDVDPSELNWEELL